MAIEFRVRVVDEPDKTLPAGYKVCASSSGTEGNDALFAGYGENVYEALHDLINNLEEGDVWRRD